MSHQLLATIDIQTTLAGVARIELCQGDLTETSPEDAVDILVVSAYPNNYVTRLSPRTTLIDALDRKGISVSDLATSKYVDLRQAFSCWLSNEIPSGIAGINFKRILCFEPHYKHTSAPEAIGDIFRALAPFVGADPHVRSVAMPLVATGDQGYAASEILPPLVKSTAAWLKIGLPLYTVKIYTSDRHAHEAEQIFRTIAAELQDHRASEQLARPPRPRSYDAFISYAHTDSEPTLAIARHLQSAGLRVFIDQLHLDTGAAWQQEIFRVMDQARAIIVLYSPDYVSSKVCQEEFNIAWARRRKDDHLVIYPIYWLTSRLPTYMDMVQWMDCREGQTGKLEHACKALTLRIRGKDSLGPSWPVRRDRADGAPLAPRGLPDHIPFVGSLLKLEVVGAEAGRLGERRSKVFAVEGGTIGRVEGNDWVLPDQYVSSHHAAIRYVDGQFVVIDTNSSNGVFLNTPGYRLEQGRPYAIKTGDRLLIDPFEIHVSVLESMAPRGAVAPEPPETADRRRPSAPPPSPPPRPTPQSDPFATVEEVPYIGTLPVEDRDRNRTDSLIPDSALDRESPVDPLVALGLPEARKKSPSPRRGEDLAGGSPLNAHFEPPRVIPAKPSSPAASPSKPEREPAPLIPANYDPLAQTGFETDAGKPVSRPEASGSHPKLKPSPAQAAPPPKPAAPPPPPRPIPRQAPSAPPPPPTPKSQPAVQQRPAVPVPPPPPVAPAPPRREMDLDALGLPGGSPRRDTAHKRRDHVGMTVFGPESVRRHETFFVQVVVHPLGAEAQAIERARVLEPSATMAQRMSVPQPIALGSEIAVHLASDRRVRIDEPRQTAVWSGNVASLQFAVRLPWLDLRSDYVFIVELCAEGLPIGRCKFRVRIGRLPSEAKRTRTSLTRYSRVFLSYAHEDLDAVADVAQLLELQGLECFFDRTSLRTGSVWELDLQREIALSDLFLLCWSMSASKSKWVRQEVDWALYLQRNSPEHRPDIRPFLLEGPPIPDPPRQLRHLHFGSVARLAKASATDGRRVCPQNPR